MEQLEKNVRAIEKDGLVWGAGKFVAVGYGIRKLQINLVVEDEKVSTDELQSQIEEDEDHVQSTDVVSCPFDDLVNEPNDLTSVRTGCYAKVVNEVTDNFYK